MGRGSTTLGAGTVFAVLTGAAIAAYTLWDKRAVGPLALSPIVPYWGTNLANAALLTPVALRERDELRRAWTLSRMRAAVVGLLSPLAYVVVLYALVHAPVSYVAPAARAASSSTPCWASWCSTRATRDGDSPPRPPSSSGSSC
jgi:hypothetical protein